MQATGKMRGKNKEEEDVKTQEEQEETRKFSRRRITSNWDRYKEPEKEESAENDEPPRGTNYSVLLSSAGDSFSQFRFADEKEWQVDTAANTQMSAFFDCQALVQSLQELPLYLRLNVDAELVQVTVPTELPQFKITEKHGKKSAISHFRGQLGRTEVPAAIEKEENISSHLTHESGAGFPGTAMDITAQKSTPAHEKVDGALEEELEELLSLDAPVSSGLDKRPSKGTARDKRSKNSANVGEKVETSSGKKNSLPEPLPSRSVTKDAEEKLEDWLDSMIS